MYRYTLFNPSLSDSQVVARASGSPRHLRRLNTFFGPRKPHFSLLEGRKRPEWEGRPEVHRKCLFLSFSLLETMSEIISIIVASKLCDGLQY